MAKCYLSEITAFLVPARKLRQDQLIISTMRLAKFKTWIKRQRGKILDSLLQPDTLLLAHYLAIIRRENHLDQEKILMLAVPLSILHLH